MTTWQNIGSPNVWKIRCKHGNDRVSKLQTSNIQVATILRIKGWMSFWTHLKYEHCGRNLSSIVNKLCSTLSSYRRFGSGRALTMVSISRQSSSMIVTVLFDLKIVYKLWNTMLAEWQKEEKRLLGHIKWVYRAFRVSPVPFANFSPLVSLSALLLSLQHLRTAMVRLVWRKLHNLIIGQTQHVRSSSPLLWLSENQ